MYIKDILSFILLLSILIGIHEYGHLFIARKNGVFCETFSIGMGPKLCEWKDKYNTNWRISLLPIGGYVKMFGDEDATSVKEKIPTGYTEEDMEKMSAFRKKPWQRLLIALGGPFANFILAIFLLFGINAIKGIPFSTTDINVVENSVAAKSGLKSGDKILSIGKNKVNNFNDIINEIKKNSEQKLSINILRNQDIKTIEINEKPIKTLGISPSGIVFKKTTIFKSFTQACISTYDLAIKNVIGIFSIFKNKQDIKNIGGPISIFKITSKSADSGLIPFLIILASLSTILGAINLLPIPVLDGGTVLISMIEWIIGKRVNEKIITIIFSLGAIVVIGLMGLGLWNDIISFFKK